MHKYLYFYPLCGFSDILWSLHVILLYCKKYDRILLFNTMNSLYKINFSDYFDLPHENIIYDHNEIVKICKEDCDIYPSFLGKNLSDIINGKLNFSHAMGGWGRHNDKEIKLPTEKRPEKIIFMTRGGGGHGYLMFKTLTFKQNIISHVMEKYSQIKKPYLCIQVRNTDRKSDYKLFYRQKRELIHSYNSIYIATDDINVLEFFQSKELPILNFTAFGTEKHKNLHGNNSISPHTKILDLITDIYIIVRANKFLSNSIGGFIKLVRECRENQDYISSKFSIKKDGSDLSQTRDFSKLFRIIN